MFNGTRALAQRDPSRAILIVAGLAVSAATLFAIRPSLAGVILSADYLPHRFCYLARPALVWTHVIADTVTGIAYTIISVTLAYLIHKGRRDIPFHWMFLAFGLFIVACGGTHVMEAITVWIPVYVLSGIVKVFTALVSGLTAILLPFTIPQVLTLVRQAKTSEINKKRFVGLLETAPDAIVVVDNHGEMVLVNAQAERTFGYSREELLGHPIQMLFPMDSNEGGPADPINFLGDLGDRPRASGVELTGLRRGGHQFPVEVSLSPLETEEGTLVSSAIRDISDRKQAEENLRQAQQVEGIGRLAGGIAHDFNNVLSVILGHCEMLNQQSDVSNRARKEIGQINTAAQHAADLTRQLLAFGRQQVMQTRVIDLNRTIVETSSMIRRLIGEDIEVSISQAESLWPIKVDPSQVTQVIVNLAVNARDAMPSGGRLTIETENVTLDADYARKHTQVPPGAYVLLAITDTGMGMNEAIKSRIFDPFFTTKEMGKGTGLGLATVYGIVKQSGGFIWVYSEPEQGTTFKIYFPRSEAPKSEDKTVPNLAKDSRGTETILVLEDNDHVREVAVAFLQSFGYTVLEAGEPEKALEIAEMHDGPINLLLTDVVLPRMSGRIVGEKIMALRPSTKVLFVSGYTSNVIVQKGILEDGVAFLQKPYTREGLAAKVRAMLNQPAD
jgi:PAS domain S-box-containing protein